MHGLSPRTPTLSPLQIQTSVKISEAVPEMPTTVSDIISQMAVHNYFPATLPLDVDDEGAVIQNQRNQDIISCIELALTSNSEECNAAIKSTIFINATEHLESTGILKPYLVEIIRNIKDQGLQLNLDGIELNNLKLNHVMDINLNGMSARGATFNQVTMNYLKMEGADFTGAHFIDCPMEWARLDKAIVTDATFSNVRFYSTDASELTGNQSDILQSADIQEFPSTILERDVVISMTFLKHDQLNAKPDRTIFTLRANQALEGIVQHSGTDSVQTNQNQVDQFQTSAQDLCQSANISME